MKILVKTREFSQWTQCMASVLREEHYQEAACLIAFGLGSLEELLRDEGSGF